MAYLGDIATLQRLLTNYEIADLLTRHPFVAAAAAETKAAILAGLYDWEFYDHEADPWVWMFKFPGIIEPRGEQFEDAVYKLVTVFPARNGEIYFSGWSARIGDANKPDYEPPPFNRGPLDDITDAIVIGAVILGGIYLFSKSGAGGTVSPQQERL